MAAVTGGNAGAASFETRTSCAPQDEEGGLYRRDLLVLLGGAVATWPLAARAQQAGLPVVGVLYGVSQAEWADRMAAMRRGLAETGFVDGRNVVMEYRWAEGHLDQMPWMAVELIVRRVAVMMVGGDTASLKAFLTANRVIPTVFTTGADPIQAGLVPSLNRPGGNATGVTTFNAELGAKRLELLHEVVPGAKKIAFLVNENNRVTLADDVRTAQTAAPPLGLEAIVVNGGGDNEIEAAFASAVQQGAGAVYVGSDGVLFSRGDRILALAQRYKLPVISSQLPSVRAGQLISYGTDEPEMYRQAGVYIGRILKGEKPGDLPVVQPTKFELRINLKTAKALGLAMPPSLLSLADEVIE
jgi:putative ABC transport system substrate-binding protein